MIEYTKTHRCEGSVKAKAGIDYEKIFIGPMEEDGPDWHLKLFGDEWTWETGKPVFAFLYPISFCPFCGEKLEKPKDKTNGK